MATLIARAVAGWRFVVDVARLWYHGGIGDLAAGVTFWILVSLPAAALGLLAALGTLDTIIGTVIDFGFQTQIEENLQAFAARVFADNAGIQDAVSTLFRQDTNPGLLTLSLAVALWSISRGFAGLIRALDDIYHVIDGRPWYYARVVALLLGVGSLLISVPLVALERLVWDSFADGPSERVLRNVLAMGVLVGWAITIYHYGPASRSRWRHDLCGAVVAAVLWWLLSVGFSSYVRFTNGTNGVTAAVGAGLLVLTWLWLAAQVLLIGGAVNYLYGERRGISRRSRARALNDAIVRSTDEIRKIVVTARDQDWPGESVGDGELVGDGKPVAAERAEAGDGSLESDGLGAGPERVRRR